MNWMKSLLSCWTIPLLCSCSIILGEANMLAFVPETLCRCLLGADGLWRQLDAAYRVKQLWMNWQQDWARDEWTRCPWTERVSIECGVPRGTQRAPLDSSEWLPLTGYCCCLDLQHRFLQVFPSCFAFPHYMENRSISEHQSLPKPSKLCF
jgi:hypothetical protein